MSREKSEAIIYRLIRYSDSSAIALAFTRNSGKMKLFVPKAYTKRGGVVTFMPGLLDYGRKETDLHRYYCFEPNTLFYKYLDNHDIILRLHLIFEIYDGFYHPDMPDEVLYELLLKIDDVNYRKITAYIIYFILKRSGVMYELDTCANCSSDDDVFTVASTGLYCPTCAKQLKLDSFCDKESAYIIKCFGNSSLYRNITVNRKQELQVLSALGAYAGHVLEKPLKSLKTLMDIL